MPTLVTRPYTGTGDDSLPDSVKALPAAAKKMWVAAFNSAWDSYDPEKSGQPSQEGYAMAVAWGAVNKSFKKNADGEWVERSLIHYSYGAPFTNVKRSADGTVRWRTTCSNDGVDLYATRMTTDLHDDFIRKSEQGCMPLLTVAHYYRLAPVGITQRLYRDGRRLKAEGVFFTSKEIAAEAGVQLDDVELEVAQAAAASALEDAGRAPVDRKLRTSIGFSPALGGLETEDLGVIAYTRGELPEIAMTTKPGNSRVDFAVEQRSGEMTARIDPDAMEEDAAAILGVDLAAKLRERFDRLAGQRRSAGQEEEPDAAELIYRSFAETNDVTLESAVIAASAVTAADPSNPDALALSAAAKPKLVEDLSRFARTAPWERSTSVMRHRLEDVADAEILERAGLVKAERVAAVRAQLFGDLAAGVVTDLEGTVIVADEIRSEKGDLRLALPKPASGASPWTQESLEKLKGRTGRRLQGKRLDQLNGITASLKEVATGLEELLAWAKENDEEPRSVAALLHDDAVEPSAKLLDRMGMPDADASLVATMDFQAVMDTLYRATFVLSDIISANLDPDTAELTTEERLSNADSAVGEYLQIVNSLIMGTFGGGRSAPADNRGEMSNGKGAPAVKPDRTGQAPVNLSGEAERTPDLSRFDTALDVLRQKIVEGATAEELQEALVEEVEALNELLPASAETETEPLNDALVERIAQVEVGLESLKTGIEELLQRSQPAPAETPRMTPRRRSLPPGPLPAVPATRQEPQVTLPQPPKARTFKIDDIARRSVEQTFPASYP